MPDPLTTQIAFRFLNHKSIHDALKRRTPNPVSKEVTRLILTYVESFRPNSRNADYFTRSDALATPIEEIAYRLASSLFNNRDLLAVLATIISTEEFREHE